MRTAKRRVNYLPSKTRIGGSRLPEAPEDFYQTALELKAALEELSIREKELMPYTRPRKKTPTATITTGRTVM